MTKHVTTILIALFFWTQPGFSRPQTVFTQEGGGVTGSGSDGILSNKIQIESYNFSDVILSQSKTGSIRLSGLPHPKQPPSYKIRKCLYKKNSNQKIRRNSCGLFESFPLGSQVYVNPGVYQLSYSGTFYSHNIDIKAGDHKELHLKNIVIPESYGRTVDIVRNFSDENEKNKILKEAFDTSKEAASIVFELNHEDSLNAFNNIRTRFPRTNRKINRDKFFLLINLGSRSYSQSYKFLKTFNSLKELKKEHFDGEELYFPLHENDISLLDRLSIFSSHQSIYFPGRISLSGDIKLTEINNDLLKIDNSKLTQRSCSNGHINLRRAGCKRAIRRTKKNDFKMLYQLYGLFKFPDYAAVGSNIFIGNNEQSIAVFPGAYEIRIFDSITSAFLNKEEVVVEE
ncbi:MAG: hypothetical protein CL678_10535 [Bdellovibrionaceae bacterium]|nr:hypothetical protein [Pseudobdellovibrionaceae bacterium]|tara:strand:- start:3495 stop:4691 length:1197 start_codon:yes stop_codon:yes gene_type:complete